MEFSTAGILAGVLFGGIGVAAFIYGKKQREPKPLVIGLLLMVYPLVFRDTLALYAIGVLLTAGLFLFND